MKRALVVGLLLVGCGGGGAKPGGTGGSALGGAPEVGGTTGFHIGDSGTGGVGVGGMAPTGTVGAGGSASPNGGANPGAGGSAPGIGGTVGAGGNGSTVSCLMAGSYCPDPTTCCVDSTCVAFSGGVQACAANCTAGSQCNSACCAPLSNTTTMVCVPADNCASGTTQPETGTVIAVDSNYQHMLIQTASGQKLFSSVLDCFVFAGSTVTFDQPTAACVSNTLTYSTGTCSVTCDGTGYSGQVVTATTEGEYSIATTSGTGMYRAMLSCFLVSQGNQVVFGSNPSLCLTNYFYDTASSEFCDVYCNE